MAFPGKNLARLTDLELRQAFFNIIYTEPNISQSENPQLAGVSQQLAEIGKILGRSAGNEPTVYDNGSFRSSATGTTSLLTQQVERALTQVLGRSPGRGSDGFVSALNSAFPTNGNGQVTTSPSRSVVSLTGTAPTASNGNGFTGQLSVEQANLYRQTSIIAADALRVLDGLQPFDPTADVDAVEALRALVRSQINALVEEFGRIDQPRKERVDTYLNTLFFKPIGSDPLISGNLQRLGEQARLTNSGIPPVTAEDEAQIAGFELLVSYINTIRDIWEGYMIPANSGSGGRYSERLSRANIMLPVIADSNTSFMAAMDSIGFTESERRSNAALFIKLGLPNETVTVSGVPVTPPDGGNETPPPPPPLLEYTLPDMTVNDFNEWVERFSNVEAPSILSTSGQFGLDFVTDQADTLFWVIGFVLFYIKNKPRESLLKQTLVYERVKQTLNELIFQLYTLAELGVRGTAA